MTEVAVSALARESSALADSVASTKPSAIWYVYMIRCAGGELYTGVTTDVSRRFKEHQAGGAKAAKYLRGRGPLQLAYQETIGDKRLAHQREYQLKQLTRKQKLALIAAAPAIVVSPSD